MTDDQRSIGDEVRAQRRALYEREAKRLGWSEEHLLWLLRCAGLEPLGSIDDEEKP